MKINIISNGIYEIENFITDNEINDILYEISNIDESQWHVVGKDYTTDFWNGKTLFLSNSTKLENIYKRFNLIFKSKLDITGLSSIQRYRKNESIGYHTDHWIEDAEYAIAYGLVIYYNDNYSGGEIEYPELGITIKPKKGSLIMHKGDILHGTLPVLDDSVRYFSSCFVKENLENPAILNFNTLGENNAI